MKILQSPTTLLIALETGNFRARLTEVRTVHFRRAFILFNLKYFLPHDIFIPSHLWSFQKAEHEAVGGNMGVTSLLKINALIFLSLVWCRRHSVVPGMNGVLVLFVLRASVLLPTEKGFVMGSAKIFLEWRKQSSKAVSELLKVRYNQFSYLQKPKMSLFLPTELAALV